MTSGQGSVSGTVTDAKGRALAECEVDRDFRLGFGFGGFDGLAYTTDGDGEFTIPVNAGVNRLRVTCPGSARIVMMSVVWRGSDRQVEAVLDGR